MQKWEYMQINLRLTDPHHGNWTWSDTGKSDIVARLNQLGREGWELVSTNSQIASIDGSAYTRFYFYIFKRQLS